MALFSEATPFDKLATIEEPPLKVLVPARAIYPRMLFPLSWAEAWFDIVETPFAAFATTEESVFEDTVFARLEMAFAV